MFANIAYLLSHFHILTIIKLCYLTLYLSNSVQVVINGEGEDNPRHIPIKSNLYGFIFLA